MTKRACSAPPTELINNNNGKQVVLQRMELKSPLTVRQSSAIVPFNDPNQIYPTEQQQQQQYQLQQRAQTPLILNRQPGYYNNNNLVYNGSQTIGGRPILKSNSLNRNGFTQIEQQQQVLPIQQQQQQRNIFLNRAYSDNQSSSNRVTNGYETDSGLSYNRSLLPPQGYNNNNTGYSSRTLPRYSMTANSQRVDPVAAGYETDSGLVKLRHVLESNKRGTPLQTMPNGYYYNRSECLFFFFFSVKVNYR